MPTKNYFCMYSEHVVHVFRNEWNLGWRYRAEIFNAIIYLRLGPESGNSHSARSTKTGSLSVLSGTVHWPSSVQH